jgi:uncharacterized membrane protein
MIHGMGFGALYLLAASGALVELYRRYSPSSPVPITPKDESFLRFYLIAMAALAWLTVLTGTYIIYPWYRAVAPVGTPNLAAFPQMLLKSNPATIGWHSIGMEWKEHIAWLTPISITMAAAVFIKYGQKLRSHPQLRAAILCFTLISFLAAGIAGFFGAMLVKHAPVEGGHTIQLMQGE